MFAARHEVDWRVPISGESVRIGLTLPNRGVLFGVTTAEEMVQMAEVADRTGVIDSIWVGDSLLGKPRMESIALLAGIATRTERVRIGPACMASFPLRDPVLLAYQWASLDLLARGRTVLATCTGIIPQEGGRIEGALYNLESRDRVKRLIEWLELMRRLWTEENVDFDGEHYRCKGITIEPKPAAKPRPPLWIASNAGGTFGRRTDRELVERTLRRAVNHSDGWQTSLFGRADLDWRLDYIRDYADSKGRSDDFVTHIYHNININEDRDESLAESKRFLDTYYTKDFPSEVVTGWTATGSVDECVEHLIEYRDLGVDEITLRITGWDQRGQLERLTNEVIPAYKAIA